MPLLVYPRQMLQRGEAAVTPNNGAATNDLYYLLLALFNRTGGGDGGVAIGNPLGAVAPPGTLPLIQNDWNVFTVVPAGGACQLPPVAVTADFIIWNFGANPLAITPQPNQEIDTLGAGAAYSLAVNKMQWFRCTAQNQLLSTQLG